MSDETLDPSQLAEAIKGMSDDQLEQQVSSIGVDTVLGQIFDGMEEAFQPETAQGENATIQYDIKTNGDVKQYSVEIAEGKCTTSEGAAADPKLTLQLALVDFVRLIFGQAEGPQLFMTGKLKLKGDMMFAMKMQKYFARPG